MSILLAIVAVTIKSLCSYDFIPTILCHMSLNVALVIIPFTFECVFLIDLSTPTNISSTPLLEKENGVTERGGVNQLPQKLF